MRHTEGHFNEITHFIREAQPDVVGLVEMDSGSYRCSYQNQAAQLADAIGHYHSFDVKYKQNGMVRRLPVFNKQANAFLTRDVIQRETFHFFESGFKRLVIELELEKVNLFLVHLSLRYRVRQLQLADLHDLVRAASKPCIVAGDFNAFMGERELRLFLSACGLVSANRECRPTYPSWRPRRELDFICCSPSIAIKRCTVPRVTLSDHLPMICDFELPGEVTTGGAA
ncbi:MAG: endonuclease/exonuclease/phosphatase family protein [Kiritimatiellae bacterium]|nr:endonuclease/exonuclease/phosphatase family protein [Kiritimatiellia bacterium]